MKVTQMSSNHNFDKLVIATRYRLLGMVSADPSVMCALNAFEWALLKHSGRTRNGGQPEFIHQLEIFSQAVCFHHLYADPQIVYADIFLHDTVEDLNVTLEAIGDMFGTTVRHDVDLLSKEVNGVKKNPYSLDEVFANPRTAVAKTFDRCNNVSSMIGVFKPERLQKYVKETREQYLPRIKEARRVFPTLEPVFETGKLILTQHLRIIDLLIPQPEQELS